MVYAGNGLVYMMGGDHLPNANYMFDVYVLDTKPSTASWSKLAGYQIAPLAGSVYVRGVHAWDGHLYVTGNDPLSSGWTSTCNWFGVFRLNLTAPTAWTNVSELYTTSPCKATVFSQDALMIRYFVPSGSGRRASTSSYLVFDLRTLDTQVRVVMLACMHVAGSFDVRWVNQLCRSLRAIDKIPHLSRFSYALL